MTLELKLVAVALVLVSIFSGLYSAYDYVYDRGYNKKTQEVQEYQDKQAKALVALSKQVADMPAKIVADSAERYTSVLLAVKNKPLYVIDKSGKCLPSKDFDKAYRELLK